MTEIFANNAEGVLAAEAADTDTSFTLESGHTFPAPSAGNFFRATLWSVSSGEEVNHEIVHVTDVTSDVATVERAKEGTTARTWPTDTGIELRLTAGALGSIVFYTGLTEELPCADQVVSRPEIKDYAETRDTPASSSGALTIDLEAGNVAEATLTEDTSIDFTNPPAAGKAGSLTLILKQDGTGGWSVTWPGSVVWPGGSAPSLSTAADAIDVLTFVTTDGGTTWYGFLAGAGMA